MKKYRKRGYRSPRTTAEIRANQEREYVRGKRLPSQLPNLYDDIYSSKPTRCWKDHRKTQYRDRSRGEQHVRIFDDTLYSWGLKEWFEEHSIPYDIEYLIETYSRLHYDWWERRPHHQIPVYNYKYKRIEGEYRRVQTYQIGYK